MRSSSCAFCGEVTDNLLEVYPGSSVDEKQAFCGLCIETAAPGISFRSERDLSNRVVLQTLYRLFHTLLREVRELRRQQETLAKRIESDSDPRF